MMDEQCQYCRRTIRLERYLGQDFWIDNLDSDTCPGDANFVNLGRRHEPEVV